MGHGRVSVPELVAIDDTRLAVVRRGDGPIPLLVLHGGPGLDHHEFAHHLDALGDACSLLFVDQRGQGSSDRDVDPRSLTLERMAQDVTMLTLALGLPRAVVLGHSYGAFVALQHAVDYPRVASASIISCGVPSTRHLAASDRLIRSMRPVEVRDRVLASLAREAEASTPQELAAALSEQWPVHFADPMDPRIADYERDTEGASLAPEVLRRVADDGYRIELEDRLAEVRHPVLVIGGRHDRACPVEGSLATARGIRGAELVVFERSGHMPFVEEPDAYVSAVRDFLERRVGGAAPAAPVSR